MDLESLKNWIDDSFELAKSESKLTPDELDTLKSYEPAILAALSLKETISTEKDQAKVLELWENQTSSTSQFRIRRHVILIQDVLLVIIRKLISSGVLFDVIGMISGETPIQPVNPDDAQKKVMALIVELLAVVKKLDKKDFCVFVQAEKSRRSHRAFNREDLEAWFPHEPDIACNMPEEREMWNCGFCGEDNVCIFLKKENNLTSAIKSLEKKGLLKEPAEGSYCFRW